MKRIFLFLFILVYSTTIHAQTVSPENMKVGVVLSGGGAKGLAHIGVLKALEEANIQIDYIGGTSMGSIVGGLYAIGYSAEELESIVKNNNFFDNLSDDVPRNIKPFYLKEIDDKYNVKLAVEKNKIILPSGFTNGQNLMNSITKYTQHVGNIQDFNQLPIPFLCIATDLETGKQVVLNKGDLIKAIRASAAYPTLVKPIEIDDKWLVDGGIVNNFPVDEVKDMGANFIIGVEVSSHELYEKDNLRSVVNIVEQLVSYQMVNEENSAKAGKVNIYFRPIDEEKYSTFSFDKADEIIQLGYETAKQQIDTLIALGKIHPMKEKKEKVIVQDVFKVRNIYFTGKKDYTYAYLMEKLQLRKGKIITFEELTNGVNRLWATDNFTNIQQKVVIDGDEGDIYIDLTLNPVKSYFHIGLTYDDLFKAGVLLNWTDKSILFGTDYLSADLMVGENLRYNLNYFIDNGFHLSVGLQSTFQNFDFNSDFVTDFSSLPPEMNDRSLKFTNLINRLNFQYLYRDNFAWGFGAEHIFYKVKDVTTQELEQNYENSHFADLYTYFKFDTYDNRMFPRKGFYMNLCGKWFLSSSSNLTSFEPFLRGKAHLGYVIPLSKKFVIHPETEIGLSFTQHNTNPFLDFHLGGTNDNYTNFFTPFYGYPFAAMGNSSYLKTSLTLRYELTKNHFLGIAGNIARTDDNFIKDFEFIKNTKKGFGVFYGIKTILAPVQVTYSRSPELKKNFFSLKIGYWF